MILSRKNDLKGGVSALISTLSSNTIETCSGVTNALAITFPSFPCVIGIEFCTSLTDSLIFWGSTFSVDVNCDALVKLDSFRNPSKITIFFSKASIK